MGDAQGGRKALSGLSARLTEIVCRWIRPDACEALMGDLAEAGATERESFVALLGFLARSKLTELQTLQTWLILAAVVAPAGLMLNIVSSQIARNDTVYVWMYAHNWTWTYFRAGWLWSELLPMLFAIILLWLRVAVLSGLAGFLLARSARRTAWLQGSVFVVCLTIGQNIEHLLLPNMFDSATSHAVIHSNAAAFATSFYRLLLPRAVQMLITVAPALYGIHMAGKEGQSNRRPA